MSRIKNIIRNINYLSKHSLWDKREEDIVYLTNKILDDVQYEYELNDGITEKFKILDSEASFDLIMQTGKSFVRTGDGEIKILMGIDQPFQKYSLSLSQGLARLLSEKRDDLLVGINRNYFVPGYISNYSPFFRRYAYDYRQYYKKICNTNITYIDSTLTGYILGDHNSDIVISRFKRWKEAFIDKEIVIVCGESVLKKLEFDIFENARSRRYIYGPSKNAWEERDYLVKEIHKNVNKNQLIIFILGMAGKVLTSELTEEGYTCWDVGHLAKYYDAFMKGIDNTEENIKDFFAPD